MGRFSLRWRSDECVSITVNYYNDNDPFCVEWLENLVRAGLIPPGDVDGRSIEDVQPGDLSGYDQVHLFAGIGGWSQALRIAGWPDDRPVWTASCPCPPFSTAGKKKVCPDCEASDLVWHVGRTGHTVCVSCGHSWLADARHLWPEAWRLISECGPARVYGEQVDGAGGLEWITGVQASLEILSYASWFEVLPAACVGAPHSRHRIFWVADAGRGGDECRLRPGSSPLPAGGTEGAGYQRERGGHDVGSGGTVGDSGLADSQSGTTGCGHHVRKGEPYVSEGSGLGGRVVFSDSPGFFSGESPSEGSRQRGATESAGSDDGGSWDDFYFVPCRARDGRIITRRVGTGVHLLADGVPSRSKRLRAFGNAIVPDVAALFIQACEG